MLLLEENYIRKQLPKKDIDHIKKMNDKLSKTKNYPTLVSMYEINSLLKEFKCSFPTMVDSAVIFSQK